MNLEQQLYIFGHLIWTALPVKGYSSDPNCWKKVIVALVLLTADFFLIFFIPWFPVTFHLWYHTIRLCSQTWVYVSVIMTSYSFYWLCQASDQWWSVRVLSGRSQVLLPLNFRSVSCFTTINDTLKSSADLLSFIDSKQKLLYREDHTPKSFVSDTLKYFQKAQERDRVKVLHEKLPEASQSNKLATTLINLKRKFPSHLERSKIA